MLPGIDNKNNCCGCRACEEICPKSAISMIADDRDFMYPFIDKKLCISCGLCERVCPNLNHPKANVEVREATVAVHKNIMVLEKSSSGGAFNAIINAWNSQSNDGYVAGVRWNEDFSAFNDISNDPRIINQFSKSKYILSDTSGIFTKAKNKVLSGERVLFSGTPCQVAAFRNVLGQEYDNLLLVDIVCHGAPSSALLKKHIAELEKRKEKNIVKWSFRDKTLTNGNVSSRSAQIIYDDGESEHFEINEDAYLKLYYSRMAYRKSCEYCRFASPERVSDITIGDAHHINELYPDLSVEKGTSIILFHTPKGLQLKNSIAELMTLFPIEYDWAVEHNEQLRKPTCIHPRTSRFYRSLEKGKTFETSVNRCLKESILKKLCRKVYRYIPIKNIRQLLIHKNKRI